jgi:hypothetical protein
MAPPVWRHLYGAIRVLPSHGTEGIDVKRKTTVWLSARETALLRRISADTGRSQSDLIRLGIKLVAGSRGHGAPGRGAQRREFEWMSRQEGVVLALRNARYPPAAIARELFVSEEEVHRLMESVDWKLDRLGQGP